MFNFPKSDRMRIRRSVTFLFITAGLILHLNSFSQSVSLNTTGAGPNASAALDVDFPDKGLLIPRLALQGTINAAPLAAHVAGMIVYNTATVADVVPGLYINNGTKWLIYTPPKGTAPGNMFYWNGTTWVLIPPGSPGQKLQLNTTGVPVWI